MIYGEQLCQYYDQLLTERVVWDNHWQELAEYLMPRKASVNNQHAGPNEGVHERLFDSTGVDAVQKLAGGCMSWITPASTNWFFLAPDDLVEEDEEAADWLADATATIQKMLAESNFYTEVHELYLDRSGFGTANLYEDYDESENRLFFDKLPIGSYVCAENARGMVDTVIYLKHMTARAAAQLFGEENLPEKIRKDVNDPKKWQNQHAFLHAVFPRRDFKPGNPFASNFPIASVWVAKETKEIVSEGGYLEMPYFVTRFLRWEQSGMLGGSLCGSTTWGWSPGWMAMPDLRQLNHLEKQMDALADRNVNPPLLMPEDLDTRADLRPGGITLYDASKGPAGVPRQWIDQGRYDIGVQRAEEKRQRARRMFLVDLFNLFEQLDDRQRTATEIRARLGEKLDQISPTFALLSTELLTPLLTRTFSLALRHNRIKGPIPRALISQDPYTGQLQMLKPKIQFNSRLAQAIEAAQNQGTIEFASWLAEFSQVRPEILDNLDWDGVARQHYRMQGGDQDLLIPRSQMEAMRLQRAQMAAQAEGVDVSLES